MQRSQATEPPLREVLTLCNAACKDIRTLEGVEERQPNNQFLIPDFLISSGRRDENLGLLESSARERQRGVMRSVGAEHKLEQNRQADSLTPIPQTNARSILWDASPLLKDGTHPVAHAQAPGSRCSPSTPR